MTVDYVYRGTTLAVVAVTLVTLAVVASILRIYVRVFMVKSFGIDDWFMSFATIFCVMFGICVVMGVHYGTGYKFADLTVENRKLAMEYWWYCYLWYCCSMILSKISIGVFLLRIAVQKMHRYCIYLAMVLSCVTGAVFFFVTIFQCSPVSYFWNQDQEGSCIPIDIVIGLTFLYSALNIIADFTFALLPIFIVSTLQMDRKLKMVLMPLLGMGCVASSAVVVRLAYVETFRDPEFLYATVDIAIWSITEPGIAITAGSLACLRPLFKRLASTISSSNLPSMRFPSGQKSANLGSTGQSRTLSRGPRDMFSLTTFGTNAPKDTGEDNDDGSWDESKVSTRKLIITNKKITPIATIDDVEPGYGSNHGGDDSSNRGRDDSIRRDNDYGVQQTQPGGRNHRDDSPV